jgi:Lon protease-like protein
MSEQNPSYPVLPLRDIVVFPHMIVPLFVGREKSVRALEEVMQDDKQILLSSQIDPSVDDPAAEGIYRTGVLANVLQLLKLPDSTVKVLVEGKARVRITEYLENPSFFEARAEMLEEDIGDEATVSALVRSVSEEFERYAKIKKNIPEEALAAVSESRDADRLADLVAGHLGIEVEQKQDLLETLTVSERLEKVYGLMQGEMSVLQVEKKIKTRVKSQMERTQREYYLNEQMKAIQKELGDGEDGANEIAELEEKIAETKLSKEAREKAEAEVKKLKSMSPMSAEATVVRNYLDWMLSIPWGVKSRVKKDLHRAEDVLDKDHYGLEKVKERIVEYLAVQQRSKKLKGPIMCLVGPPGVGKTSLGKSVAKATGREFIRISLGGVRDESEIRGHRRTYIGSMPGKIIQAMKKAKTTNPLILLDEIDKMGQDFRGDPASAMLEVLDPEQNATFSDHYLEVEYDLSNVMFITTANSYNMPGPLLDRMEIIPLAGYTEDEKSEIAKQHLIPKQIQEPRPEGPGILDLRRGAAVGHPHLYPRGGRAEPRARAGQAGAQGGDQARQEGGRDRRGDARDARGHARRAALPLRAGREGGPDRRDDGPRLDQRRRRSPLDRGAAAAGQGPDEDHRQARRRDEGVDRRRLVLRALGLAADRREAAALREVGHPRPRPRGRDAQGRALGRRGDGDLDRLGADADPGAQGHRHDRRGHAARQRAGDRRAQGKAARGAPRRHPHRADPGRERQGPAGNPRQREGGAGDHPGRPRLGGAEARARPRAGTGGMGRGRRGRGRGGQGRGRAGRKPHGHHALIPRAPGATDQDAARATGRRFSLRGRGMAGLPQSPVASSCGFV